AARIDYVFVSPDLASLVLRASPWPTLASDHLPVVVDLAWPQAPRFLSLWGPARGRPPGNGRRHAGNAPSVGGPLQDDDPHILRRHRQPPGHDVGQPGDELRLLLAGPSLHHV